MFFFEKSAWKICFNVLHLELFLKDEKSKFVYAALTKKDNNVC